MKRSMATILLVLAACLPRAAADDADSEVWLRVPVPLKPDVAKAVGRCLAKAIREVPPREGNEAAFQAGETVLPRQTGEAVTVVGNATPWKKSKATGSGQVVELAPDAVRVDVRGGPQWRPAEEFVRLDEVVTQLDAALRERPNDSTLLLARACSRGVAEQFDEAIADLNIILLNEPERIECLLLRAGMRRKLDRDDAALTDYTKVIELGERLEYALRMRARILLSLGRKEEAIADYERLLLLEPADVSFYTSFAALRASQGDDETARELLRRAAKLELADVIEVVALADALLDLNDDLAAELLERATNMPAETAVQLAVRGWALARLKDVEAAKADWSRALEVDPQCVVARLARAHLHLAEQDWQKGMADLDAAVAIDPADREVVKLRRTFWMAREDWEQAIAELEERSAVPAEAPEALMTRALIWWKHGKEANANHDFAAALRADPGFHDAIVYRAWLWAGASDDAIRDPEAALHSLLGILTADDLDLGPIFSVVQVFVRKGDFEQAVRLQEAVLELRPDDQPFQAQQRARLQSIRARWASARQQAKPKWMPAFPGAAPATERFGAGDEEAAIENRR